MLGVMIAFGAQQGLMEAAAAERKTYKYRVHDQKHMRKWTVAEWLDFSTMKRPPTDAAGGA
jgi:hypothetical protein